MNIDYGVTGKERKALAYAVGEILNCKSKYLGTPNFGFAIGFVTVDKNGTVIFEDTNDNDEVKNVIQKLSEKGFTAINVATDPTETATKEDDEVTAITTQGEETEPQGRTVELTVEMPRDYFTETALANLEKLVTSKADLIKKALGIDSLEIEITEDKVSFPWFHKDGADEGKAYTHFVTALCEMARTQKRINTKEVVEQIRKEYPVGTRVELLKMDDPQAPPIGTLGTVMGVDDTASILVRCDNNSGLHIVYGVDLCRKIK